MSRSSSTGTSQDCCTYSASAFSLLRVLNYSSCRTAVLAYGKDSGCENLHTATVTPLPPYHR
eukprot:1957778-Amphidinium_carterae.2